MKLSQLRQLIKEEIFKEIKINAPNFLSPEDKEALKILTEYYGEGVSEAIIEEPMEETYSLSNYDEDNEKYQAMTHLLKKPGVHIYPDIFDFGIAPGAPKSARYTRVTSNIDDQTITVESPYVDMDGTFYVGWFDLNKKYHPDTENFTEDGEYIGDTE